MNKKPYTATAAEILILLNALVWFGFAALVALDLHPGLPDDPTIRWVMGILAFGCAGTLFGLTLMIRKRIRIAYYSLLGLLALLMVATFTDEIGLADILYLALVTTPFLFLIRDRAWYFTKP
jgi:hypothetical protein